MLGEGRGAAGGQQLHSAITNSRPRRSPRPPPPRTQIYEQEAEYLNADYTHFGTVLKAR